MLDEKPTPSFNFLGLPRELRDKVYYYCFEPEILSSQRDKHGRLPTIDPGPPSSKHGLLTTNRQIHTEYTTFFSTHVPLNLSLTSSSSTLGYWPLPPTIRNHQRHLHISISTSHSFAKRISSDPHAATNLRRFINSLPKLEHVELAMRTTDYLYAGQLVACKPLMKAFFLACRSHPRICSLTVVQDCTQTNAAPSVRRFERSRNGAAFAAVHARCEHVTERGVRACSRFCLNHALNRWEDQALIQEAQAESLAAAAESLAAATAAAAAARALLATAGWVSRRRMP
ncbi:hypothetical protein EJ06DRAFT_547176 [Trichodelitschia bisporula]|uniref:F-box domain-containing protein n=1 Tax=Trichodelitschia bisporula TaxID=703511 RepID=A0A6G1I3K7_9PEZI|nr:hypothetical protein EJ06DRAFT_547176 [Trichodelitschia bisporula]